MHAVWDIFRIQISPFFLFSSRFVSVSKGPRGLPGPLGLSGKPGKRVRAAACIIPLLLFLSEALVAIKERLHGVAKQP